MATPRSMLRLIVLSSALTACGGYRSYTPAPLDTSAHAATYEARRLDDPNLLAFLTAHGAAVDSGATPDSSIPDVAPCSSYATNLSGIDVIFFGDTVCVAAERVLVRGSEATKCVAQFFVRGQGIVGATLVNNNPLRKPVTEAIRNSDVASVESHVDAIIIKALGTHNG